MRIIHTADIHLGVTLFSKPGTKSRLGDLSRTLIRFAQAAVDNNAEVAVIAGDIFNSRRPEPRDMLTLVRAIDIMKKADITIMISPGNHDGPDVVGDIETQTLHWLAALEIPDVHAFIRPFVGAVTTARGNVLGVVSIPYPHQGAYDSIEPSKDRADRVNDMSIDLDSAIRTMHGELISRIPETAPKIFMGHLTAVGSMTSSETSMKLGWDVTITSDTLDLFDYGALGHIHRQQHIGQKSMYAGSPEYIKFTEAGSDKGFVLIDVTRNEVPKISVIDSHPRKMYELDVVSKDTAWLITPPVDFKDAIVHLRIHAYDGMDDRDINTIVKTVRDGDDGASFVRYEVIRPEKKAVEAATIRSTYSPSEALAAWLSSNSLEQEPFHSLGVEILREAGLSV